MIQPFQLAGCAAMLGQDKSIHWRAPVCTKWALASAHGTGPHGIWTRWKKPAREMAQIGNLLGDVSLPAADR